MVCYGIFRSGQLLLVNHNSFGTDTIHFVFLEISGRVFGLERDVTNPPLANYF